MCAAQNGSLKRSSGVNVDIQHHGHGTAGSDHTDASSYDDVKNSSSNHLVPQISTISGAYKQQMQMNGASVGGGSASAEQQQPTSFGQGLNPNY